MWKSKDVYYLSGSTCTNELQQSHQIFLKYDILMLQSESRSIDETATQVAQILSLKRKIR
ncbi:MAG: hypothetical protein ABFS19_10285 [Thermodesulfobacteriota bacterium]